MNSKQLGDGKVNDLKVPTHQMHLKLYTVEQVRELDRLAIKSGMLGYDLMKQAGESAFHFVMQEWPHVKTIAVVLGTGNNAGDGYVIAKLAKIHGLSVRLVQLGDASKIKGDALLAYQDLISHHVVIESYAGQTIENADVIIDALFGTGLKRSVAGIWRDAIEAINQSKSKVASIDIPSGLNANTGQVMGVAVNADICITFIGRKKGMYTLDASGKINSGNIKFDSLQVSKNIYQNVTPTAYLLQKLSPAIMKPRNKNTHKGQYGNIVLIGGAPGMSGAILLSASAALRTGCGLVTVFTHPQHAAFLNATCPEIMSHAVDEVFDYAHGAKNSEKLLASISAADAVVIGPGLGTDAWGKNLFERVVKALIKTNKPLIIDADGLNNLASSPALNNTIKNSWVLTPHPGEAARLLGCDIKDIQQDRFKAAKRISEKFNAVCVLKGAGTIIHDADAAYVCPYGNPGMASPGMGDVLTGVVATLLAQSKAIAKTKMKKEQIIEAVNNAVMLHSMAADRVAEESGEKGMIASDLFPAIRSILNGR